MPWRPTDVIVNSLSLFCFQKERVRTHVYLPVSKVRKTTSSVTWLLVPSHISGGCKDAFFWLWLRSVSLEQESPRIIVARLWSGAFRVWGGPIWTLIWTAVRTKGSGAFHIWGIQIGPSFGYPWIPVWLAAGCSHARTRCKLRTQHISSWVRNLLVDFSGPANKSSGIQPIWLVILSNISIRRCGSSDMSCVHRFHLGISLVATRTHLQILFPCTCCQKQSEVRSVLQASVTLSRCHVNVCQDKILR